MPDACTPVVAKRSRYNVGEIPSFFWNTRRIRVSSPKQARGVGVRMALSRSEHALMFAAAGQLQAG